MAARRPAMNKAAQRQPRGTPAGYFPHAHLEAGSPCSTTMTLASIPVLQQARALFAVLQ